MKLIPDAAWAVATIWMESRGEPQSGKVGVAEVIRDRVAQHYMCNGQSIAECVLRPLQFSSWSTHDNNRLLVGELDDADPVVQSCAAAWATALSGSRVVNGALIYLNPAYADRNFVQHIRATCDQTAEIGGHLFFRPR